MTLRERAALRNKAKMLKKELDSQNLKEIFDNVDF